MAQQFSRSVSLTSASQVVEFGFKPSYVRIDASTAGTAYLTFGSTQVATTNSSADSNSWQLTSGNVTPLLITAVGDGGQARGLTSAFAGVAAVGTTVLIRVLAVRV